MIIRTQYAQIGISVFNRITGYGVFRNYYIFADTKRNFKLPIVCVAAYKQLISVSTVKLVTAFSVVICVLIVIRCKIVRVEFKLYRSAFACGDKLCFSEVQQHYFRFFDFAFDIRRVPVQLYHFLAVKIARIGYLYFNAVSFAFIAIDNLIAYVGVGLYFPFKGCIRFAVTERIYYVFLIPLLVAGAARFVISVARINILFVIDKIILFVART